MMKSLTKRQHVLLSVRYYEKSVTLNIRITVLVHAAIHGICNNRCFFVFSLHAESWNLTEALEMWLCRRTLRVTWLDRITNVLKFSTEWKRRQRNTKPVKARTLQYLGHIVKGAKRDCIIRIILQGKVLGTRGTHRGPRFTVNKSQI